MFRFVRRLPWRPLYHARRPVATHTPLSHPEHPNMSHAQHPLHTPFSPASTATEVARGIDLSGHHAIITGGHAGIGLEVTRALATTGASILLGARDPERARQHVADLPRVSVAPLDLADPRSIDAFAHRWLQTETPLHLLINNAATSGLSHLTHDARGYELQFAISHLGHFQLTGALLPALRAAGSARVVNVSSGAHRFGTIRWDDVSFATGGYTSGKGYAQAKLANVLFAVELDRRWRHLGIRGYAVHPGVVVGTKLNASAGDAALRDMGLIDASGAPIIAPETGKKTAAQGASTIVFAATSPLLDDIGGVYLLDNDISPVIDDTLTLSADTIPAFAASWSIDAEAARRLWEMSERMLDEA